MVTVNELQPCQQYPAWNSPNLNHVSALLQLRQQVNLPSFPNSSVFTANALSPGISTLLNGSPNLETAQPNRTDGVFSPMLPHLNILSPTTNQCLSESQPAGRQVLPIAASGSSRKKFLIFDQSGDQTRLFISPSFSPQNELLSKKSFGDCGSQRENLGTLRGHGSPMKPIIEEQLNRTHGSCKESEMHEDSEEINALLYSDRDEDEEHDDDDVDGEDDEVTSTGHSPFMVRESINDHHQFRELSEDVASSDGSSKRQRLHDGGYKKSFIHTATSAKIPRSCTNADDVESSCVKESNSHMCSREKKIRIRETLRILQSLILDINSNDPLLVIDEAINYLKYMKLKVKEMGVELPQAHTSFPQ